MKTNITTYYTLLIKSTKYANPDINEVPVWEIHFGDYDREVVEDERDDVRDTCRSVKIICTNDDQKHIDHAVEELNSKELHDRLKKATKAVEDEAGIYISVCDECEEPFETDISTVDQIVCGDCLKKWTVNNKPSDELVRS